MWYLLAREVLYIKGKIARGQPWEVMPDLFLFRDPEAEKTEAEETKDQGQEVAEVAESTWVGDNAAPAQTTPGEWNQPEWGASNTVAQY